MSSGVEFEEDKFSYGTKPKPIPGAPIYSGVPASANNQPPMIRWLMRHGIAKTPGMAQGILGVIVVIDFAIAYFVIKTFL